MSITFTADFVYAPGSGTVISLDGLVVVVGGVFYTFSSLVWSDAHDAPALLLEETDPEPDDGVFIDANVAVEV